MSASRSPPPDAASKSRTKDVESDLDKDAAHANHNGGSRRQSRRRSASSGAEGGSQSGLDSPTFFLFRIGGRQSIIRSPEPQRKSRAASAGSRATSSPRNHIKTPSGQGTGEPRPRRHSTTGATITASKADPLEDRDDDDDDSADPFATLPPLTRGRREESASPTNRRRQRHHTHSRERDASSSAHGARQRRQQQHPDSLDIEKTTSLEVTGATQKEKEEICAKIASLTASGTSCASFAKTASSRDEGGEDSSAPITAQPRHRQHEQPPQRLGTKKPLISNASIGSFPSHKIIPNGVDAAANDNKYSAEVSTSTHYSSHNQNIRSKLEPAPRDGERGGTRNVRRSTGDDGDDDDYDDDYDDEVISPPPPYSAVMTSQPPMLPSPPLPSLRSALPDSTLRAPSPNRTTSASSPLNIPKSDKSPNAAVANASSPLHLPKPQSPTITLLQKAREGQLPKAGASYINSVTDETRGIEKADTENPQRCVLTTGSRSNDTAKKAKPIVVADARYFNNKELAKVEPKSIREYAPGEGSIAKSQQDQKRQFLTENGLEELSSFGVESKSARVRRWIELEGRRQPEAKIQKHPSRSPSADQQREWYRDVQKGGEIPMLGLRKVSPSPPSPVANNSKSPTQLLGGRLTPTSPSRPDSQALSGRTEKRRQPLNPNLLEAELTLIDEEQRKLNREMAKFLVEDERRRKKLKEEEDLERRKHSDFLTPDQKSPIPQNRFDDLDQAGRVFSDGGFGSRGSSLGRSRNGSSGDPGRRAVALFNFYTSNPKELSFEKGSILYINRQVDNNWFDGEFHGNRGIFPVSYVEVVNSPEQAVRVIQAQRLLSEGQAKTKFNFVAQSSMEMSLRKGEIVVIIRRVDANWYEGKIGSRRGIFPCSYVDVLAEPGSRAPPIIPTTIAGLVMPSSVAASVGGGGSSSWSRLGTLTPQPTPPPHPTRYSAQSLSSNDGLRPSSAEFGGGSGGGGSSRGASPSPCPPYAGSSRPGSSGAIKSPSFSPEPKSSRGGVESRDIALRVFKAAYNYNPQKEDELYLRQGDIVYVIEECDDGWFVGSNARSGRFGTFPGNFVEPHA